MQNAIASAFLSNAAAQAEGKRKVVDLLIRDLAAAMRDIHGGEWMIILDHKRQMVSIFQDYNDDGRAQPKRGEVV